MSKVFIVGGSGQIARHLAKQLNQQGHTSLSLYRQAEQAEELETLGTTPVHGVLLTLEVGQLAELMTGCDVVVFSAGAGGKGGPEMTAAMVVLLVSNNPDNVWALGIDRMLTALAGVATA